MTDSVNQTKKKIPFPFKIVIGVAFVIVVVGAFLLCNPETRGSLTGEDVVSSTQLKQAINIDNLSSAEFVYNGIAEKYKDNTSTIEYRVAYDATVKVGIRMSDIDFDVDRASKTVTPRLPEIIVNSVSVDINTLSYMPKDPGAEIKDVIEVCENDVKTEASNSSKFYQTAEENMKSVVEALTLPLIKSKGYSLVWDQN